MDNNRWTEAEDMEPIPEVKTPMKIMPQMWWNILRGFLYIVLSYTVAGLAMYLLGAKGWALMVSTVALGYCIYRVTLRHL